MHATTIDFRGLATVVGLGLNLYKSRNKTLPVSPTVVARGPTSERQRCFHLRSGDRIALSSSAIALLVHSRGRALVTKMDLDSRKAACARTTSSTIFCIVSHSFRPSFFLSRTISYNTHLSRVLCNRMVASLCMQIALTLSPTVFRKE